MTERGIVLNLEPLALNRKEAARLLSISERKLATLTKEGKVPSRKMGRRVVYPYKKLQDYINGDWKPDA